MNIDRLEKTLSLEVAALKAFRSLTAVEQSAYRAGFPQSKFIATDANQPGGRVKMDDVDPGMTATWAKKNGVNHKIHPGEGGSARMSSLGWHPGNAKLVHSYVKKNWNSGLDPNVWANDDAHSEVEGWGPLHKHVTGKEPPKDSA